MMDLRLSDIDEETDYDNGWTEIVQDKFEEYLRICKEKSTLHGEASSYYSKWYRYVTYPIIVVGGVNTVIASLNVRDKNIDLSYIIAILSGVHATTQAISSFVEYGKRSNEHSLTAIGYASLARYIESQLWLKPAERDTPKFNFEVVTREMYSICTNEPSLPSHIQRKSLKQTPTEPNGTHTLHNKLNNKLNNKQEFESKQHAELIDII